ncbi:MAG TPA: hypothetical protein VNZ44_16695 [Pyrinomonadaceae bacterium]|nr:hypothetical protein [Pyrinomonadaceae bacterium]
MPDGAKGHVSRAALTRDALAELMAARFDETAVAVVRRVDWAEFVGFKPAEAGALLEAWTEGQLFDSRSEIRWRESEGAYDVLLLTESDERPPDFRELRGAELPFDVVLFSTDEAHGFLLWGTDSTRGGLLETRIPRLLNYPSAVGKRMRLAYKLYKRDEAVCWVRLSA